MRRYLVTLLLFTMLISLPYSKCDPNEFGSVLKLDVSTDSDWCTIKIQTNGTLLYLDSNLTNGDSSHKTNIIPSDEGLLVNLAKQPLDNSTVEFDVVFVILGKIPEINFSIYKGFIGLSNISLSAFNNGEFISIYDLSHSNNLTFPETNPLFSSLVIGNNFSNHALDYYDGSIEKQVFACYYPWYSTPDGPGGGYNHWDPINNSNNAITADFPILGPYDSQDVDVIRTHIEMAKDAGIDGFLCSWSGVNTTENIAIDVIIQEAAKNDFKIGIYYESLRGIFEPIMNQSLIIEELTYLINKFRDVDGYLHFNGNPVVFIYQAETQERNPEFWTQILDEVENREGDSVFIGELRQINWFNEFDGMHTYNELNLTIHEILTKRYSLNPFKLKCKSSATLIEDLTNEGAILLESLVRVGTVVPGYDDTEIRTPGEYIPRENLTTYRKYWQNIHNNDLDWVIITSFNEWHEGTEIEPSKEYGFTYLQETLIQSSRFKQELYNFPLPSAIDVIVENRNSSILIKLNNSGPSPIYSIRINESSLKETASAIRIGPCEAQSIEINENLDPETNYVFNVSYWDWCSGKNVVDYGFVLNTVQVDDISKTLNVTITAFNQTLIENKIEVSASMVVNSSLLLNYCSLDVILDGNLAYGENWMVSEDQIDSEIPLFKRIHYDSLLEVASGNHSVQLVAYARNNSTYLITKSPVFWLQVPQTYLNLSFSSIDVNDTESSLLVNATVRVCSVPKKIEYASIDILLNDTIVWSNCWSEITGNINQNLPINAPAYINSFYQFKKPKTPFILSVRSYARNEAKDGLEIYKEYSYYNDYSDERSLKQYALYLINKDRENCGVPTLEMSSSNLAQVYANELLVTNNFRHNPKLPYGVAENLGMIRYYTSYYNLTSALDRLEYLMMYEDQAWDWGHRDNIINRNYRTVSIGISFDDEYFYYVQNFYR